MGRLCFQNAFLYTELCKAWLEFGFEQFCENLAEIISLDNYLLQFVDGGAENLGMQTRRDKRTRNSTLLNRVVLTIALDGWMNVQF